MKKSYHLVTTEIIQTWDINKTNLLLGPWCKSYTKRNNWSKYIHEENNYHWNDRDELLKDDTYLKELYQKIMPALATDLNKIHSVKHDLQYWKIFVGLWLIRFLYVSYDRWRSIELAFKKYNIETTTDLDISLDDIILENSQESIKAFGNDLWNNFIYLDIIKFNFREKTDLVRTEYAYDKKIIYSNPNDLNVNSHINNKVKIILKKLLSYFSSPITLINKVVFFAPGLSKKLIMQIELNLCQIPAILEFNVNPAFDTKIKKEREQKINFGSNNQFETYLEKSLLKFIPKSFIENYAKIKDININRILPKNPKLIITSTGLYLNDSFKLWTAEKISKGSKLAIIQHGGNYGSGKFGSNEFYELDTCNSFINWGQWKNDLNNGCNIEHNKKISELEVATYEIPKTKYNPNGAILILLMAFPRYLTIVESTHLGPTLKSYTNELIETTNELISLNKDVIVRHNKNSGFVDDLEEWKNRVPDLKTDKNRSVLTSMSNSRLNICTYNATTLLELLGGNYPTLIYWNPKVNELRENAVYYFNELKKVGILHENRESLKLFINNIYGDVGKWWFSKEVQNAVLNFNKHYALRFNISSKDWVKTIKKIL